MKEKVLGFELITSKANSTIVKIGKLEKKKYRDESELFVCDGIKLFEEAVNFNAKIEYVLVKEDTYFDEEIIKTINQLAENGTRVLILNEAVYSKISLENAPQGLITVCSYLDNINFEKVFENRGLETEKIMIFESIRDPGNLGTIMRNAAAFGIDRLILSHDCVDVYSQKVIRSAMGAIFKVNIDIVDELVETIKVLKNSGKTVLSANLSGKTLVLGKRTLNNNDVIAIGNEGHGLSDEIINVSDDSIIIPMNKNTESLNAAMASAIFMWEMYK